MIPSYHYTLIRDKKFHWPFVVFCHALLIQWKLVIFILTLNSDLTYVFRCIDTPTVFAEYRRYQHSFQLRWIERKGDSVKKYAKVWQNQQNMKISGKMRGESFENSKRRIYLQNVSKVRNGESYLLCRPHQKPREWGRGSQVEPCRGTPIAGISLKLDTTTFVIFLHYLWCLTDNWFLRSIW